MKYIAKLTMSYFKFQKKLQKDNSWIKEEKKRELISFSSPLLMTTFKQMALLMLFLIYSHVDRDTIENIIHICYLGASTASRTFH